ncbi:hypothetical protein HY439_00980 [Candidatus Microgenomates bacterium]|nr:hypothetical protein [Candidatus Microgenomates bacterium]
MAYVSSINKNKLKKKAFTLRKKQRSYNTISRELGIPKSTLSNWFKADVYSSRVKKVLIKRAQEKAIEKLKLMAQANKEKWRRIHLNYRNQATQEFPKLFSMPLFGPGLMIYWGEGDKRLKNGIVRISNIDYRLLKIFIAFLRVCCQIQLGKIRLWLLLYPDLNEKICKEYWSKILGVSQEQFVKSQYILGREKKRKVDHGVCSIQVYSRELKEKIIEWINLYNQALERAGIV